MLLLLPLAMANAQDDAGEPVDRSETRCIRVSAIDRIEIVDDRNLAFHMRNGDIYLNRLDRACRGLDRGRPYSYRASGGRLCSVDAISMIDDRPFDLTSGSSCGLGEFSPIDEESLAILKGEEEEAEITVVPIEVEDRD